MAMKKCKMCGNLFDSQNAPVAFCSVCGSKQTLPVVTNDGYLSLLSKADELRFLGDYEKASGIYELLAGEMPTDAEIYWSLVMCRYGISYVKDLSLDRYVLRVNRMQKLAVTDDEDFKKVMKYASENARNEYVREVNEILSLQKAYFGRNNNSVASPVPPSGQGTVSYVQGNPVPPQNFGSVENMTKRMYMFLEDKNWAGADKYCEMILDNEPENTDAYIGKLLIDLKVSKKEDLRGLAVPFGKRDSFRKCMRFCNDEIKEELKSANDFIAERNESRRLENEYNEALKCFNSAKTEEQFKEASMKFHALGDYKDSLEKIDRCLNGAEVCRKENAYNQACTYFEKGTPKDMGAALEILRTVDDWKNAPSMIKICEQYLGDTLAREEEEAAVRKQTMKIVRNMIISLGAVSCVASVVSVALYMIFFM